MRWIAYGVTAVLALLVTGAAPSAPNISFWDPAWSPDGKKIAFASTLNDPGGSLDIYVMNAGGSNLRQLTDADHAETGPSWSPDGKKIAFQAYSHVDVMNADGTGRYRLVHNTSCCGPDWSPKGRRIAYTWYDEFKGKVYVVKPDGTGVAVVAAPPTRGNASYSYGLATWSPDGQRIAFSAGTAADSNFVKPFVGIVSQYRGRIKRLARGHTIFSLDWSPNGRKILLVEDPVVNNPRSNDRISVLDVRTGKLRFLGQHASYSARWSPDGRRIAYAWQNRLYVMNADGSYVRDLTPH